MENYSAAFLGYNNFGLEGHKHKKHDLDQQSESREQT